MIPANRPRHTWVALALWPAILPVLALGLTTGVRAQTLDCTTALGPVAEVICSDPELIELDLDIGDAFRELVRATPRTERRALLRSQRDWLIQRNGCLGDINVRACLRDEIEYRLTDLSQGLASVVNDDQPFGRAAPATAPAAEPQGPRETIDSTELPAPPGAPRNGEAPSSGFNPGPVPPRVGGATPPARPPDADAGSPQITAGETQSDQPDGELSPRTAPEAIEEETVSPIDPVPLNDDDAREIAEFLTARVWRAEIASGVRPGTIYMFHSNGLLLTADCVEAYRIGSWRIEGAGLRLNDGAGRDMTAEIVDRGNGYVRLKLREERSNKVLDLVFRPARSPFACIRSR